MRGLSLFGLIRKRGGVQKSMGRKVAWNTEMLIYLRATSRALIFQYHFKATPESIIVSELSTNFLSNGTLSII